MLTYLDCVPCFFKQALEAARIAGADEKLQREILNELAKIIPDFSLNDSPPEMGRVVYSLVKKLTGKKDPYKALKEKSNNLAQKLYPELKEKILSSKDSLLTAVELAIAGNIIDYGAKNYLNVDKEIEKLLKKEYKPVNSESRVIFDYFDFKNVLDKAQNILYIADNAGEIVFDKLLIEEIKKRYKDKRIVFAVRDKPVINDALIEDALSCGIDKLAEVISSGSDAPGTVLGLCSREFLEIYRKADMVISKGQGNFESLSGQTRPIFFMFMAKCPVIAKDVSDTYKFIMAGPCRVGDVVLLYNFEEY